MPCVHPKAHRFGSFAGYEENSGGNLSILYPFLKLRCHAMMRRTSEQIMVLFSVVTASLDIRTGRDPHPARLLPMDHFSGRHVLNLLPEPTCLPPHCMQARTHLTRKPSESSSHRSPASCRMAPLVHTSPRSHPVRARSALNKAMACAIMINLPRHYVHVPDYPPKTIFFIAHRLECVVHSFPRQWRS